MRFMVLFDCFYNYIIHSFISTLYQYRAYSLRNHSCSCPSKAKLTDMDRVRLLQKLESYKAGNCHIFENHWHAWRCSAVLRIYADVCHCIWCVIQSGRQGPGVWCQSCIVHTEGNKWEMCILPIMVIWLWYFEEKNSVKWQIQFQESPAMLQRIFIENFIYVLYKLRKYASHYTHFHS